MKLKKFFTVKNMARVAILSALAAILMILDFPSFIAPGNMYKLDFGDLPCLLGGFAMGPFAAFLIVTLKILIKLLFKPTTTAFVGELANYLLSLIFCVVASFIYKKNKTKKNALKALVISSALMVVVSGFLNQFVLIPFFSRFYGIPVDNIISMGQKVYSDLIYFFTRKEVTTHLIHDTFTFVAYCVIPFNILKAVLVDILIFLLYKRVSPLLKD